MADYAPAALSNPCRAINPRNFSCYRCGISLCNREWGVGYVTGRNAVLLCKECYDSAASSAVRPDGERTAEEGL